MRKVLCLLIGMMLTSSIGCDKNEEILKESNDKNHEITSETEIGNINGEMPIDFSIKENWETTYKYMECIGKTAAEISEDYSKWKYLYYFSGGYYYVDLDTGMNYIFSNEEIDGDASDTPQKRALRGDEICGGILDKINLFFPNAVWPTNIEETKNYLKAYIGLDFKLITEGEIEGSYLIQLANNKRYIMIGSIDGIITPDTKIMIFGESMMN